MVKKNNIEADKNGITLDIDVNKEGLDDAIEELKELKDNKPNIIVRNNQNVYITINNFNETEKEYTELIGEEE